MFASHHLLRPAALAGAASAAVFAIGFPSWVCAAGISTADSVVNYVPGNFVNIQTSTAFQNSSALLGAITGDTTFGGVTPFNPPFSSSQIVALGTGGELTLHLSQPVPANGRTLGVFTNNGLIDVSGNGSGTANATPGTLHSLPEAVVSVSQDGNNFVTLNNGNPLTFDIPTNDYLDQPIVNGKQPLGSVTAFQSKPFLGTISSFSNENYAQIKTTLNASAGGTWIDTSGAGLPSVNYVRFDVPAAANYRMVVDSVAGMTAAAPIAAGQSVISESVGSGANTSHIVVDFGPQSFEFNVHYDGSISGEQALQLLQADSIFRFNETTASFGKFVSEEDYGGYDFSGSGALGNDFWSYWVGDGSSWDFASTGASDRLLTNGSYDGWVWFANQSTAPDMPTAVPEPASLLGICGVTMLLQRRRRR